MNRIEFALKWSDNFFFVFKFFLKIEIKTILVWISNETVTQPAKRFGKQSPKYHKIFEIISTVCRRGANAKVKMENIK